MFEVNIAPEKVRSVLLEEAAPKMGRPPLGRDNKVSAMLDDDALAVIQLLAAHMDFKPGRLAGEILNPLLKALDLGAVVQQIEDLKAQSSPLISKEALPLAS